MAACLFLHWFTFNFSLMDLFIWLMQYLITIPTSDFSEFISLHFGFFWKFFLWSFSVIKDWFRLYCSILSSKLRSFAKAFASVLIAFTAHTLFFFYVLLMFSISNLLYSSIVSSYKLLLLSAGINNFGFFFIFFTSLDSCIWKLDFTFVNSIFWTM